MPSYRAQQGLAAFMKKHYMIVALLSLLFALPSQPQKGAAPNGYYPPGYNGSTFTGVAESSEGGQLALLYTKGNRQERFVGRLDAPCVWTDKAGTTHTIEVSSIPAGDELTAFYNPIMTKSGAQKIKENVIIAISYAQHNGKKIPEDKRVIVSCTKQTQWPFKAFYR
jgi:hypothetical protein